eukprot:6554447-Alexandrium_andersonii.AAC.1
MLNEMLDGACSGCIDESFSQPIIRGLRDPDPAMQERTLQFLCDIADKLRVSSSAVERHHLLSSVKRSQRGGKNVPLHLSVSSYLDSVRAEFDAMNNAVKAECFGSSGARVVAQNLRCQEIRSTAHGTSGPKNKALLSRWTSSPAPRKSSPWNEFIRKNPFKGQCGSTQHKEHMAALSHRWGQ